MASPQPRLIAPYPNGNAVKAKAWDAGIYTFVANLVIDIEETTAAQLFALFDAPENDPALFYLACTHLLRATRQCCQVGEHVAIIAALFGLLKAEGLKRDDPDGEDTFELAYAYPTLRLLAEYVPPLPNLLHARRTRRSDIPIPPGYKLIGGTSSLTLDPEYVKGDSFMTELANYGREHEGMVRLWALVGRLEADRILGEPGVSTLLFHRDVLCGLEDPAQRGVWDTLWAAVLHCNEDIFGKWGEPDFHGWLGPFKDALREIAGDDRAPLEWRGRFALILEGLSIEK
ncbi:hypothetical protein B0H17DRAFT_1045304 [Mycena rosella]|uniref:Uncharacterized protein n=1 Tax=Mycena rosella TaxID=1033263 RepID=A0AAD7DXI8_MYCRO|nr:hypothetical protein B0H17DRAFT_1045304 [Mycena rosella]